VRPDGHTVTGAGLVVGALVGATWLCRVGTARYRGLILDEQIGLWAEGVAARVAELSSP
jgi:hypothetical protein